MGRDSHKGDWKPSTSVFHRCHASAAGSYCGIHGVLNFQVALRLIAQLISESYNNSHNRVKITPQGGVTIFGVNITPKRSYFFLCWS